MVVYTFILSIVVLPLSSCALLAVHLIFLFHDCCLSSCLSLYLLQFFVVSVVVIPLLLVILSVVFSSCSADYSDFASFITLIIILPLIYLLLLLILFGWCQCFYCCCCDCSSFLLLSFYFVLVEATGVACGCPNAQKSKANKGKCWVRSGSHSGPLSSRKPSKKNIVKAYLLEDPMLVVTSRNHSNNYIIPQPQQSPTKTNRINCTQSL